MCLRWVRFLAALAALSAAVAADAAASVGGCPVFPSNHYWNTPVDTLPLHPSSNAWVNSIGATTRLHPDWGNILSDNYGIPFVTVAQGQPSVPIVYGAEGYPDESDLTAGPIPSNAPVEGGASSDGDRHVLVIDTSQCVLYELYRAFPLNGGTSWRVDASARFDLRSNALRPAGWTSADAAGFAIFPGLVRWDEVAAGEIAHAIRFTASRIWGRTNGAPYYLWPARHWSGSGTDPATPPMGARFRLKASFDISAFDPRTQVILRAFKKYGLVLADGGGNWYFQGVSDERWPDRVLNDLKSIAGSNFEGVDTATMMIDADSAAARQASSPTGVNYQALWWRSPAASESGWGVNITHQGDILFATWFTYDATGAGQWFVMSNANKVGEGTYSGTVYRTTGPSFDATPWNPAQVAYEAVGSATFAFSDAANGTFTYTVNGISQSKAIAKFAFSSPVPTCAAGGSPGAQPNYTDLWWRSPANSEGGWGVNIAHQGDILFATWFTYDAAGKPLWLVMSSGTRAGPGTYAGAVYRTTGPAFSATPWNPTQVAYTQVGSATFAFADANNGTFSYTVNGISQSKSITRYVFASPTTVCQ
jgi:hypothetical protein